MHVVVEKEYKEIYQQWLKSTLYIRSVWALTKAHFQIDLSDSFFQVYNGWLLLHFVFEWAGTKPINIIIFRQPEIVL